MVISVVFRNTPKSYDYFCDFQVKAGDLVVVPTGSAPFKDFAVTKVVGIKKTSVKATLWAMQKLDVKGFNERMEERMLLE